METDGAWARTLTPTPIGLVAAGSAGEMLGGAWVSTDGLAWSPLGDPVEGAYLTGVYATDQGFLFSGATQAGTLATGIEARAAIWLDNPRLTFVRFSFLGRRSQGNQRRLLHPVRPNAKEPPLHRPVCHPVQPTTRELGFVRF